MSAATVTGTITRTIGTTTASGDYIEVVAELRQNDPSGLSDGFSITGAIWEARRNALETPDHDRAARALRIAPADLPQGMDRAAFEAFADTLRERWRDEARAGIDMLESMIDGQGVVR